MITWGKSESSLKVERACYLDYKYIQCSKQRHNEKKIYIANSKIRCRGKQQTSLTTSQKRVIKDYDYFFMKEHGKFNFEGGTLKCKHFHMSFWEKRFMWLLQLLLQSVVVKDWLWDRHNYGYQVQWFAKQQVNNNRTSWSV